MADMTTDQIAVEFERQVRLCSAIGYWRMIAFVKSCPRFTIPEPIYSCKCCSCGIVFESPDKHATSCPYGAGCNCTATEKQVIGKDDTFDSMINRLIQIGIGPVVLSIDIESSPSITIGEGAFERTFVSDSVDECLEKACKAYGV